MRSVVDNPVRRLITASASAVMVHAAVFGVVEWGLSQTAEHTPPPAQEFAVSVRLNSPEPQDFNSSESIPHVEEPISEQQKDEADFNAAVEGLPALTRVDSELDQPKPKPETEPEPEIAVQQQRVADVLNLASELSSDATNQQQIPAALRRSVDRRAETQQTEPSRTFTPERYTPPRYPEAARRRGLTGTVVVRAAINRRGRVIGVDVVGSSGVESLDSAAVRAVRSWRFARGDQERNSFHRIRFDLEDTP